MRIRCALVALPLVVTLTACGQTGSITNDPPEGSNAQSSPTASETSTPTAAPNPTFGQSYSTESGITITIGKPMPYTPSEYAALEGKPMQPRTFQVTIVNNSDAAYDASLLYVTAQSGDQEAEEIFDSPKLEGPPSTKILQGRQSRFLVGFNLNRADDIVMDVEFNDDDFSSVTYQQTA